MNRIGAGMHVHEESMFFCKREDLFDYIPIDFAASQDVQLADAAITACRGFFGQKVNNARVR